MRRDREESRQRRIRPLLVALRNLRAKELCLSLLRVHFNQLLRRCNQPRPLGLREAAGLRVVAVVVFLAAAFFLMEAAFLGAAFLMEVAFFAVDLAFTLVAPADFFTAML